MQTLLPLEGQAEDALDDKIGRNWGMNSNHIVLKMAAVKVRPPSRQYLVHRTHLPAFSALCVQGGSNSHST